ncbi:alpha/beta fold hydrolase [Nioella sp.]|uniref:alpha/beta fold hydrolase n=1 Tax=Nioella sp. TaxID=1912091 RepID=UPI003B51B4BE
MSAAKIASSDGTRIATYTAGSPANPAILLIHGWAQQSLCWDPLIDRLKDRFHIVAMDLRGHGASDKPEDPAAYTDTQLWADDVAAVMALHDLGNVTLVGWSYGSRVIASYLATYGDAALSGVVLAGGILAIGTAREDWMVGADSPGLDRDLYTTDLARLIPATARFVDACTAKPLDRETYGRMVAANMLCPATARRALFAANWDMRPTYAAMTCPGLVIHGTADSVVSPQTGEAAAKAMPHGRYLPYEGIGHAPFLEDPERFAADLAGFIQTASKEQAA